MSRRRFRLIGAALLLLALSSATAQNGDQVQQKLTRDEFVSQIDGLIERIHSLSDNPASARAVRESLPDTVTVITDSREYTVSYAWLKNDLAELPSANSAKRAQLIERIGSRLQDAEEQAL